MNSSGLFISCFIIIITFNLFYVTVNPTEVYNLTIGGVSGFVVQILGIAILSGVNALGSGLNAQSTKIIFGVGTILNILFQLQFWEITLGFGLINNLINAFSGSPTFITIIIGVFAIITLFSGLLTVLGGGGD